MILALVLAAGESKRMGKTKLLLPYGKKTIIEQVMDTVTRSKADRVFVVLGSDWKKVKKKIKSYPARITVNPHFRRGMLSSIQWGFRVLPGEARAVLIVLGDQPAIPSMVIDKVIDGYRSTGKGIVLPVHKGNRGHPVLMARKYQKEISGLSPDVGLRGTVYNHPEDILEVDVETPSILRDIDDIEDYRRELRKKED